MAIAEGSQACLVVGGIHVFRVGEIGVDGDPNRAIVEAVDEPKPGVLSVADRHQATRTSRQ
ncbi:hypothetical protein [Nocardia sp. bgisy118]|uniref:hypothetical protein n=1 Tax=Nocardia sp. bgisy118 TaxID=3413786 RepID=UPI003F4A82F1